MQKESVTQVENERRKKKKMDKRQKDQNISRG